MASNDNSPTLIEHALFPSKENYETELLEDLSTRSTLGTKWGLEDEDIPVISTIVEHDFTTGEAAHGW